MNHEEQSIEDVFEAVLDLPPRHRSAYLDGVCRGEPEIRRYIDDLLRDHERAGSFLNAPLFAPSKSMLTPDSVPNDPRYTATTLVSDSRFGAGQMIAGRFLVVRFIARGGMGEVYEVKDQHLQGDNIALKIIRPEIAADKVNAHRFEREVILARKANHPALCPIYDIFRCERPAPAFLFLTMKLLRGETLDARLKEARANVAERFTLPERLEITRQLISGVAAMHDVGIIHRDLKPNNVMLEFVGNQEVAETTLIDASAPVRLHVSILDFGLARHHEAETTVLPSGMIAGTPGYLAPEILRGQMPSKATDLFALGVVLHLVLTDERPLESTKDMAYTVAPALRNCGAPQSVVTAIEDFLGADPERRSRAFDQLQTKQGGTERRSIFHNKWARVVAGLAGAAAALGIAVLLTPSQGSGLLDSTQITFSSDVKNGPLLTDGNRLYFESRRTPAQMSVGGGVIAPMQLSDPGLQLRDISLDGSKTLAFRLDLNNEDEEGTLWAGSTLGGKPYRVSDHLAYTGRWSPDGRSITFSDQGSLFTMDEDGANVKKIWQTQGNIYCISFSPDGKKLAVAAGTGAVNAVVGRIWTMGRDGKDARPLAVDWPEDADESMPAWSADGRRFLFTSYREGLNNVYEVVAPAWFEPWKKPTAVRLTGNQADITAMIPSRDSKNIFVLAAMDQGRMLALDSRAHEFVPYLDGASTRDFVISPDRQWMAYTDYPSGNLWKSRLDGSEALQLTRTNAVLQRWSPDGRSIVYSDWRKLYMVSADGGAPEKLIEEGDHEVAPTWLPGGKAIAFNYLPMAGQPLTGIHVLDLATRKLSILPGSEGTYVPSVSPDGKYMVAIAQKPSRMVLYSFETKQWKDLYDFTVPWGYWIWTPDSKSIVMAVVEREPGIYRLAIPSGKWKKENDLRGITGQALDSFVSLTPDGRPAIMNHTGVPQIYSLSWRHTQ